MIKHLKEVDSTSKYIKENIDEFNDFDIVFADLYV